MATPFRYTLLTLSIAFVSTALQAQDATLDTVTVTAQEPTDYQAKKPRWRASTTPRCWTPQPRWR